MSRHLEQDALLAECQARQGVVIVVEGETDTDDVWFFRRWFAQREREVTFWAQNGHARVKAAVHYLREHLPTSRVYGLIDRDYADEAVLAAQYEDRPADGVFRTRRYTLENHLLDPAGWARVVTGQRRTQVPPAEVTSLIEAAYRQCIPLAAYNFALHCEAARDSSNNPRAAGHPDGIPPDIGTALAALAQRKSSPLDLMAIFSACQARLDGAGPEVWSELISGKPVLKMVHRGLGLPGKADDWIGLYMDAIDDIGRPPADLAALVDHILSLSRDH